MSVIEASRRGWKQGNMGELNLEVFLGPCRLLQLGGSLNASKEAIRKLMRPLVPRGTLPPLPLPLGNPGTSLVSL